jgi:hypothetical protein
MTPVEVECRREIERISCGAQTELVSQSPKVVEVSASFGSTEARDARLFLNRSAGFITIGAGGASSGG